MATRGKEEAPPIDFSPIAKITFDRIMRSSCARKIAHTLSREAAEGI